MWLLLLLSISSGLFSASDSARILAIVPTPSYSHQSAFAQIWKELSLRGHQVTLLTTDPANDPALTNLTEIDLKASYVFFDEAKKNVDKFNVVTYMLTLNKANAAISHYDFAHPQVQELIRNKDAHYDVVLVEYYFLEFLVFGKLFNAPTILLNSCDAPRQIHEIMGNPVHPGIYPEIVLPFYGKLNLKERIISSVYHTFSNWVKHIMLIPEKQSIIDRYFPHVPNKDVESMLHDVDMQFINVNPVLKQVRAYGPTTISIGGGVQINKSSKPLRKDLQDYFDSSKRGIIYLSLGSNVQSKDLSSEKLNVLSETMEELPYDILWKFEDDDIPNKPDNVKLIKWVPQKDILRHHNMKLFLFQGGQQSMDEALYANVPMVVMPFFGDQEHNAKLIESKGLGRAVSQWPRLEKKELKDAILDVLNNPKYLENCKRLSSLSIDQPMTGVEKAVWWTEYVIRHKGAKHLRNPSVDMPLYQYYLLDVIAFLIGVIVAIYFVLKCIVKVLLKCLRLLLKKQKSASITHKKQK